MEISDHEGFSIFVGLKKMSSFITVSNKCMHASLSGFAQLENNIYQIAKTNILLYYLYLV